jgi:hypothetical protein
LAGGSAAVRSTPTIVVTEVRSVVAATVAATLVQQIATVAP